ncbi:MAG: translation initiation factor IF-2 [Thermoplasmata archaeon]
MTLRQPIVSVLGHVDHGKTTLLDQIRGSSIAAREYGQITQHIGATEVSINNIYGICADIIGQKKFSVPGLLFIDTPGHQAFTTLRARGGALADLAILVIDIKEGIMPQTVESLKILKAYKTPFVVVANKIDLIYGWKTVYNMPFVIALKEQREAVIEELNQKIYQIAEQLYNNGFSAERYDRIDDFTKNVAIIPVSAKHKIGIADLLLVLVGLAQKFLESDLRTLDEPGAATILEVKDEKGFGKTLDLILYQGVIKKGDIIVFEGIYKPIVSRVKALLRPAPDNSSKLNIVSSATAAAGIKILASDLDFVKAGGMLKVATPATLEKTVEEIKSEGNIKIELKDDGVVIKADAIGSLEAMAFELNLLEIPIKKAELGEVSKRDMVDAQTSENELYKVILAYNVKCTLDQKDVPVISGNILYKIVDDYKVWRENRELELEVESRKAYIYPVKLLVLENNIFRVSKPAIVGVRVLGGELRAGVKILKPDGRVIGTLKSIREKEKTLDKAIMGAEIAISIDNAVVGRNLKENDILYADLREEDIRFLKDQVLSYEEKEIIEEVLKIKRKDKAFWGA